MRILQINSHYDQGGAARIAACIHRQLLKDGHESFVAYGRGKKVQEQGVTRFDTVPEVYFSALMSRVTGLNGWNNRWATRRLIRYIEKIEPDVVHLHALHGYYLNFSILFQYLNAHDIPCVWTFHDCHAFVGNCGYFFDCEKWKNGCGQCPYLRGYPASWFFDRTKYMWKRKKELFTAGARKILVTPSEWLTAEAQKSFLGKYECLTIRNGIDTQGIFYPRDREKCREKYGYGPEEKLVLGIAVGYRDPRKGVKYIIQLAKDLERQAKDVGQPAGESEGATTNAGQPARVILVGWDQGEKLPEECDNLVLLPATQDANQLAEYYSLADVFVLPSLAENYATVSLESMACGTPVVGFDAGGIPEQLSDGKGIAVKTGDQEAFTGAVRDVLSGKHRLPRGQELADRIRQENSVETMTRNYLAVYQKILGEPYESTVSD